MLFCNDFVSTLYTAIDKNPAPKYQGIHKFSQERDKNVIEMYISQIKKRCLPGQRRSRNTQLQISILDLKDRLRTDKGKSWRC